ncbi:MAG: DUF4363 family protein [Oscillospiraceae bacterium]|nr:DUF4363 family protein [Oscillospiraceae bacterium]
MRRVWICVALLLAMLGAAAWSGARLTALTGEMSADLRRAQAAAEAGEWEEASELTARASGRWQARQRYLYIVLRHSAANDVTTGLREVEALLRWRETAEYAAANARLLVLIESLAETERLTAENLL